MVDQQNKTLNILSGFDSDRKTVMLQRSLLSINFKMFLQSIETFFLSYFFVKKISLSRRVEYVVDGSMDQ